MSTPPGEPAATSISPLRPGANWKAIAGPALLLLLTLVVFGDLLFTATPRVVSSPDGDIFRTFLGWREWGFGQWKGGHFPSWNPYAYSGTPFFANMQSALFYPPNFIYWLLPAWRAVNLEVALGIYLSGLAAYFWILNRGCGKAASTYGAALNMFGAAHFLHIEGGHLPNLGAMTWTPLLFLAADLMADQDDGARGPRRTVARGIALAAAAFALILLAGHFQYFYYSVLAFVFYLGLRLALLPGRRPTELWPRCLAGAGAVLLGAGLAAFQLWPAYQISRDGLRQGGLDLITAGTFSFPPRLLITALAPGFLGSGGVLDRGAVPYWGPWLHWEMGAFIGVPATLIAIYGWRSLNWRLRTECLVLVLAFLLLAVGGYSPFFAFALKILPGYASFRGPAKWLGFALPIVALLAAQGLDAWVRARPSRGGLWTMGGIAVGIALAGVAGYIAIGAGAGGTQSAWAHFMVTTANDWPSSMYGSDAWFLSPDFLNAAAFAARKALLGMSGMALLAALCVALRARWSRSAHALALLGTLQLVLLARGQLPSFDPQLVHRPELSAQLARGPADVRYMQLFDGTGESGVLTGMHDLLGDDPFVSRRYAQFLAYSQGRDPQKAAQTVTWRQDSSLLQYLRCVGAVTNPQPGRYVLTRLKVPPLPHVFLVGDWRVEADPLKTLQQLSEAGFEPRSTVLLEKAPSPAFSPSTKPVRGEAAIIAHTNDSLTVRARASSPCLLVITDPLSAGWTAAPLAGSAQGHYELQHADSVLGAIALTPGTHLIQIRYSPPGAFTGVAIFWLSLLIWSGLLASGLWGRITSRDHGELPPANAAPVPLAKSAAPAAFGPGA